MQISEIMHKGVLVINHKSSVEEAAKMMEKGDFGSLPIEKNDKMIGMLTDRDIAIRVVAKGKNPKTTKVSECMSEGINYCFEDEDIEHVAMKMREKKQRRMPVVNRQKRLVGMVSLAELSGRRVDIKLSHDIVQSVTH
ncbi:Hypoxic response protein 1 [compost metagenome]